MKAAEDADAKPVDAANDPNTAAETWTMNMPESVMGAAQKSSKSLA